MKSCANAPTTTEGRKATSTFLEKRRASASDDKPETTDQSRARYNQQIARIAPT